MDTQNNTSQPSAWSKITGSITFKAVSIGVLILLLLIPIGLVQSLIWEREEASNSVVREVSSKWGDAQTLTGPIICVPYTYTYLSEVDKKGKTEELVAQEYAYFLSEELGIKAVMTPEILHRSIYDVVVYQAKIHVEGRFKQPDFGQLDAKPLTIDWANTRMFIGVSDMRGIRNKMQFNWNGDMCETIPGIEGSSLLRSGVTVKLPLQAAVKDTEYAFNCELLLNGSGNLSFSPVGKTTKVELSSPWSSPNFDGAFLPDNRQISTAGFTADWSVFNYNRNFPQAWAGDNNELHSADFSTKLISPVDHYQKSMRAVKYAILFIALTFLTFFLVELISRKRVHVMQYLLVSIGLILFYSLLVAFAEQVGFAWAYIISGAAIVALLTGYSFSIFKQVKQTLLMGALFIVLYVFLYVILQLEDLALLIGSVGLFIALAVVMYASRKVNWFQSKEPDAIA